MAFANGLKLGTPISKPFANAICKLLSHEHFLMSNLKRALDHLQKAISSTMSTFWVVICTLTTMVWMQTRESIKKNDLIYQNRQKSYKNQTT